MHQDLLNHLGSRNGLIHFTLILMLKFVSVFKLFGSRTTFRNELNSKTKVPLPLQFALLRRTIEGHLSKERDHNLFKISSSKLKALIIFGLSFLSLVQISANSNISWPMEVSHAPAELSRRSIASPSYPWTKDN